MGHAGVRPLPVLRPGAWLRADERALVLTAGGVFAGASAGAAMAQAAADGLFLAEIGRDALGIALAISSAFLAIVLAIVGGLADRLDRRRVLGALAIGSATVLAGLAALVAVAPSAAAWITYLGGKQLAAATDLAFWVVIAERVDARRSQRLVPLLAAVGGAGAAVGALVVIPLAAVAGPRGVLLGAAAVIALAARGVTSLPARQRVGATPASLRALVVRSWTDGARAVGQSPLARHLALVVAIAGVFGSLAYTSLGFAIAPRGGSAGELASVFAIVRGAGQAITLAVQIAVAPRVLARLGTGKALLLAPLVAVAAAAGLVVAPVLALAIATQVSARVMDASIETPAEKLAQTLLPARVRGRVAGFLDGTAKRAGAAIGGLLAAMLAGAPAPFCATVAVVAVAWWLAARRISRELPRLAIEHVAGERIDEDERVLAAVDDRALAVLVAELASARPDRAADVLARLHAQGRVDARGPLVAVVTRGASPAVWRALLAVLDRPAEAYGAALQEAARAASPGTRALAIRAVGLAGGVPVEALASWRDHAEDDVALAAEVAAARLAGEDPLPGIAAASRTGQALSVVDELIAECGRGRDPERGLEAARHLVRAIRRGRGDAGARAEGLAMLADLVARAPLTSEVALLRSDLGELARERVDRAAPGGAAEVAAALRVLGAVSTDAEDLRRLGHALGEPDDDIRIAAERALAGLGPVAAGELIATAAWGRRRARDRAAALLADLPVTSLAIDRLVEGELAALDQTAAAVAVLRAPGDELISRRLAERLREIAHTVLLLLAPPGDRGGSRTPRARGATRGERSSARARSR